MAITRCSSVLTAWVVVLGCAPQVGAQLFKPFAFPPIESDFQFFAPADVDTYGGGPAQKTGWFAAYDRVYITLTRPNDSYDQSTKMTDFTWGNRYDIGYVDDDRKGWILTAWHIDGPNENSVTVADQTGLRTPATLRASNRDENLLVTNSVNVADMTGVELNRTWLLEPLYHGARLTPFVGLRYVKFVDFYQRQTYTRYDALGNVVGPFAALVDPPLATTESLISREAGVVNDMVGGQLGVHWDRDYRRWNFSGDVKGFALQNFQNWNSVTKTELSEYGGLGPRTEPPTIVVLQEGSARHAAEFVFGMELRADAAYRVTRDISLWSGASTWTLARGSVAESISGTTVNA